MICSSYLEIARPTAVLRLVLLLLLTATSSFAQTRAPVPTAEKQKELFKLLEDGYNLPRLDNGAKKQDALAKLVESLADENLGPDERYVVLTTAISLASQTGNADEWLKAVNTLTETFDIDEIQEKTRLLVEFLKGSKPNMQVKPIVEAAIEMSHAAAKEHRFSEALSLLSAADTTLRRAADGATLKPQVVDARAAISAREKDWKSFQLATAKLTEKPDDPAANLAVGRWHLVQDSDWGKSLPFLAKASDPKWKAAAVLEQTIPTDAAAQIAVGDAWWDIAQKEPAIKSILLAHAGHWYELGEPKLTSALKKQVIAKRLDEIAALSLGTSNSAPTTASAQTSEKPGEWIDLLQWSEGADWTQRGIDWNKFVEGKPGADRITLKSDFAARYPLSAMIDGSYEFEGEFTRHDGDNSIGVFFPIGLHTMHLFLQTGGGLAGVGSIDGKWLRDNVTTRTVNVIENGVRHHFRVKVKNEEGRAAFQVDFDETKDFMKWEGDRRSLIMGNGGDFPISLTRRMWLVSHYGRVTFHKSQIRMLSGAAQRDFAHEDSDPVVSMVRLADEKAIKAKAHNGMFTSRQIPLDLDKSCFAAVETRWPLITQNFQFCQDFYGAMPPSRLKSAIPAGAKSFSVVGFNEASRISRFSILIDGKEVLGSGAGDLQVMKVDIPGRSSFLELVIDPAGDPGWDHTYWCYPRFHSLPSAKISDKLLDGRPGPLQFKIGASSVGSKLLTHDEPLEGLKTPPISFRDAVPCDEFIFAHAPSSITFKVPEGTRRFTAIGYNLSSQSTKFEVWTDGKQIYDSPQAGVVRIEVRLPTEAKTIELKVNDLGDVAADHSMWCYPRLHRK